MPTEIERKFLVTDDSWRSRVESEGRILQGYLAERDGVTVRVRVKNDKAYLTVKGPSEGAGRAEYEYPIPVADAEAMLRDLAMGPPLEKVRYRVRHGAHLWDLDVFGGANAGLVMAEVELGAENEPFEMPPWVGEEVTGDRRYYNVYLARHPYRDW